MLYGNAHIDFWPRSSVWSVLYSIVVLISSAFESLVSLQVTRVHGAVSPDQQWGDVHVWPTSEMQNNASGLYQILNDIFYFCIRWPTRPNRVTFDNYYVFYFYFY